MSRELLVFGSKTFKITVPDGAKLTFGPWKALSGTLRIYESAKSGASILAVFSGVSGYRDMSIEYAEEVAREEGAIIWKSDKDGYSREEKVQRATDWTTPQIGTGEVPGTEESDL